MKEVSIRIKEDGSQVIETSGYQGAACEETTKLILKRLAEKGIPVQVKDEKKKAEYYANAMQSESGLHA